MYKILKSITIIFLISCYSCSIFASTDNGLEVILSKIEKLPEEKVKLIRSLGYKGTFNQAELLQAKSIISEWEKPLEDFIKYLNSTKEICIKEEWREKNAKHLRYYMTLNCLFTLNQNICILQKDYSKATSFLKEFYLLNKKVFIAKQPLNLFKGIFVMAVPRTVVQSVQKIVAGKQRQEIDDLYGFFENEKFDTASLVKGRFDEEEKFLDKAIEDLAWFAQKYPDIEFFQQDHSKAFKFARQLLRKLKILTNEGDLNAISKYLEKFFEDGQMTTAETIICSNYAFISTYRGLHDLGNTSQIKRDVAESFAGWFDWDDEEDSEDDNDEEVCGSSIDFWISLADKIPTYHASAFMEPLQLNEEIQLLKLYLALRKYKVRFGRYPRDLKLLKTFKLIKEMPQFFSGELDYNLGKFGVGKKQTLKLKGATFAGEKLNTTEYVLP